jgi:serine/threonine protein kinase
MSASQYSAVASGVGSLTLVVEQPGQGQQEVELRSGLSVGSGDSNDIRIPDRAVERVHATVVERADGGLWMECQTEMARLRGPDGQPTSCVEVRAGVEMMIGPARITCKRRHPVRQPVIVTNPWESLCPRCRGLLDRVLREPQTRRGGLLEPDAPHRQTGPETSPGRGQCPSCGLPVFYQRASEGEQDAFRGWLPAQVGPYVVDRFVGRGGMGIVLRGVHQTDGQTVAIKLLGGEAADDESRTGRFANEVQTLPGLDHPNVISLRENGQDGHLVWMAMDWMEGLTLGQHLSALRDQARALGAENAAKVLSQVCRGLSYLHQRGIIHRDLKPSNIMVENNGSVRLVDFGIAKQAKRAITLSTTGTVGTPTYMAPEQQEGGQLTPATDIYALGVVWHELLTGRPAPRGSVNLPRRVCPASWRKLIVRCLCDNTADRPALGEIARAIARFKPEMLLPPMEFAWWRISRTSSWILSRFDKKKTVTFCLELSKSLLGCAFFITFWSTVSYVVSRCSDEFLKTSSPTTQSAQPTFLQLQPTQLNPLGQAKSLPPLSPDLPMSLRQIRLEGAGAHFDEHSISPSGISAWATVVNERAARNVVVHFSATRGAKTYSQEKAFWLQTGESRVVSFWIEVPLQSGQNFAWRITTDPPAKGEDWLWNYSRDK